MIAVYLPIAYHADIAANNIHLRTNLTVSSFNWQPILNDTTIDLISQLAQLTASNLIFLDT